jgi:hypothetical protein
VIQVVFGPGCYGNYLANCLYSYTDLSDSVTNNIKFDISGSSHAARRNDDLLQYIQIEHYIDLEVINDDAVIISADPTHYLDYHDNQFSKNNNFDLDRFLVTLFSNGNTQHKIDNHWDCSSTWALRELLSFSIQEVLDSTYSWYNADNSVVCSNDLFTDLYNVLGSITSRIGNKVIVPKDIIDSNHKKFIGLQEFHNIQIRCNQWVDDIICNRDIECPCVTIFDEAYVQHRLRLKGYEIKCDGLDIYLGASDMHALIYQP